MDKRQKAWEKYLFAFARHCKANALNFPVRTAQASFDAGYNAREDEVARLRKLLRDWLDNGRFMASNTPEKDALVARTQEELAKE